MEAGVKEHDLRSIGKVTRIVRSVDVEFTADSIGNRIYALLALLFLGMAVAIMGRAGATFKNGDGVRLTTHID